MTIAELVLATAIGLYMMVGGACFVKYFLTSPLPGKSRITRLGEAIKLFLVWPVYVYRAYPD